MSAQNAAPGEGWTLCPIAHIQTDYGEKFGIPRQAGLAGAARGRIVFAPPYRDPNALRGLEGYSHLWLIWQFSEVAKRQAAQAAAAPDGRVPFSPTVRPPRLGGNARVGVFASRSPNRPNALGLSCVALERVQPDGPDGPVLWVLGADLLSGTPIYDIKPYLPYADAVPGARGGFAGAAPAPLRVACPPALLARLPEESRAALVQALACDPRPAYQTDGGRVYKMAFAGRTVCFTVAQGTATVTDIL